MPTRVARARAKQWYKVKVTAYFASQFLAFCIGLAAFFFGLLAFVVPDHTVDGSALGGFTPQSLHLVWPALHCIGGGMLAYGIARIRYQFEAAGAAMLASTIAFDGAAIIYARGWAVGSVSVSILFAIVVGLLGRVWILTRQEEQ